MLWSSVIFKIEVDSKYLMGVFVYWIMFLRQSNMLLRLSGSPW
jgi:hypothetical protein